MAKSQVHNLSVRQGWAAGVRGRGGELLQTGLAVCRDSRVLQQSTASHVQV